MFKSQALAAAVLLAAGTLAFAQGTSLGTDASSSASRTAAPASPPASGGAQTTANRGKPTKDQKTFNESRNNSAGTDDAAAQRATKINTSKSNLRTGNAPVEAAPASTSSVLK